MWEGKDAGICCLQESGLSELMEHKGTEEDILQIQQSEASWCTKMNTRQGGLWDEEFDSDLCTVMKSLPKRCDDYELVCPHCLFRNLAVALF